MGPGPLQESLLSLCLEAPSQTLVPVFSRHPVPGRAFVGVLSWSFVADVYSSAGSITQDEQMQEFTPSNTYDNWD